MKKILILFATSVFLFTVLTSTQCTKSSSTHDDVVDAYLTYTHAIVDIFKNNMNSCESALLQVKAYTEKNKANIMQMKEKFESMTKNMSDEEKKKYEQRVKESLGDSMKVMMQFGQKCPQEMVKASVALEFLE